MRTTIAGLALAAALGLAGCQQDMNNTSGTMSGPGGLNPATNAISDAEFVRQAAIGGMAEVQAGQLAQQKAANPQVKAFAQQMVDDHTTANGQLAALASGKGMTVPQTLDARHQAMLDQVQGLSGDAFDRAYLTGQVTAHQEQVTLFERQMATGRDADLRALATKLLPRLRSHLQMAQGMQGFRPGPEPAGTGR